MSLLHARRARRWSPDQPTHLIFEEFGEGAWGIGFLLPLLGGVLQTVATTAVTALATNAVGKLIGGNQGAQAGTPEAPPQPSVEDFYGAEEPQPTEFIEEEIPPEEEPFDVEPMTALPPSGPIVGTGAITGATIQTMPVGVSLSTFSRRGGVR